jgi:hypothetical protein
LCRLGIKTHGEALERERGEKRGMLLSHEPHDQSMDTAPTARKIPDESPRERDAVTPNMRREKDEKSPKREKIGV